MTRLFSQQSFRSKTLVAAAFVFVVALLIYGLTLAPTVTLVDSGELIVAARFLGVAHPPGFPLYLILAHLVSLLPFGSIAFRINSASAIFAALACGILTLVAAELIAGISFVSTKKRTTQKNIKIQNSWKGYFHCRRVAHAWFGDKLWHSTSFFANPLVVRHDRRSLHPE